MCSSLAFKKTHPAVKSELKTLFEKTRAGKVLLPLHAPFFREGTLRREVCNPQAEPDSLFI